jgi:hypothetical protein
LVTGSTAASGSIDLEVTDSPAGSPTVYRVTMAGDSATITEGSDDSADATVAGNIASWVSALGSVGDRSGLRITGNAALASTVLDLLSLGQGREAAVEPARDLESAAG